MTSTTLTTPPRAPAVPVDPTVGAAFVEADALIGFVPVAGPPAIIIVGPWVLLALLVAGPFACLLTIVVALVAAAGLVGLVGAVLASPYLLARHLRGHQVPRPSSDVHAAHVVPAKWRRAVA
jgi:hypothetical protein